MTDQPKPVITPICNVFVEMAKQSPENAERIKQMIDELKRRLISDER